MRALTSFFAASLVVAALMSGDRAPARGDDTELLITLPGEIAVAATWTDGVVPPGFVATSALPRSTSDRADDSEAFQVHFVYMLPADRPDEGLDISGAMNTSIAAANSWLSARTGGRLLRVDTSGGEPDITFVRSAASDAEFQSAGIFGRIGTELGNQGLTEYTKQYVVYWSGVAPAGTCGQASGWGTYAVLFLFADTGCNAHTLATVPDRPRWAEAIVLHEIFHLGQVVSVRAPNNCPSNPFHVCDDCDADPRDIMCPWARDFPLDLDDGAPDPANNHRDYYLHSQGFLDGQFPDLYYDPYFDPSLPVMDVNQPIGGSLLQQPFLISGWAIDHVNIAIGVGVYEVQMFAYPSSANGVPTGAPAVFLGSTTVGLDRQDVAAMYG